MNRRRSRKITNEEKQEDEQKEKQEDEQEEKQEDYKGGEAGR